MTSTYTNKELAAKFNEMADKFEHIYNTTVTNLAFDEINIKQTLCGTTACHAGFAYVALNTGDTEFRRNVDHLGHTVLFDSTGSRVRFDEGAEKLAMFFGFRNKFRLVSWTYAHPEFWGYKLGGVMFSPNGYRAFGYTEETADQCNLLAIANHYRKVAKNLLTWYPWLKFKYWVMN